MSKLSIIVPVYYNADTLEALYADGGGKLPVPLRDVLTRSASARRSRADRISAGGA